MKCPAETQCESILCFNISTSFDFTLLSFTPRWGSFIWNGGVLLPSVEQTYTRQSWIPTVLLLLIQYGAFFLGWWLMADDGYRVQIQLKLEPFYLKLRKPCFAFPVNLCLAYCCKCFIFTDKIEYVTKNLFIQRVQKTRIVCSFYQFIKFIKKCIQKIIIVTLSHWVSQTFFIICYAIVSSSIKCRVEFGGCRATTYTLVIWVPIKSGVEYMP